MVAARCGRPGNRRVGAADACDANSGLDGTERNLKVGGAGRV
jgi:hypothetical protein